MYSETYKCALQDLPKQLLKDADIKLKVKPITYHGKYLREVFKHEGLCFLPIISTDQRYAYEWESGEVYSLVRDENKPHKIKPFSTEWGDEVYRIHVGGEWKYLDKDCIVEDVLCGHIFTPMTREQYEDYKKECTYFMTLRVLVLENGGSKVVQDLLHNILEDTKNRWVTPLTKDALTDIKNFGEEYKKARKEQQKQLEIEALEEQAAQIQAQITTLKSQ
ncbi:hypothetical protein QTN94_14325 [Vibrio sp. M250220]|uniref:hypothetical protein n=1 Tax=Vibrio sp. M250220 TaxID=3020894 RepID=UPI002F423FAA